MPTYILDLPTILAIFHEQKRTGELRAEHIRLRNKRDLQVEIIFYNGTDTSCLVKLSTGELVAEGDKARQMLAQVGPIEWKWTPQSAPQQPEHRPLAPSNELDLIPRRVQVSLSEISLLPRPYQRILLLVDEQRSVAQIASFFPTKNVQEVFRLLTELQAQGWLILK